VRLTAPASCAGLRLDQALAILLPEFSRSRLAHWVRSGRATVDGQSALPRQKVRGGEVIEIRPLAEAGVPAHRPEDIPLDVVYEDDALLVVNKPAGLVVHPGSGNREGTLLNALLRRVPGLAALPRAGIVHRLDKDTSGLLVVAKTLPAHASLDSAEEAARAALPAPFPLFVKPRWEGTAKGIGPSSRVETRDALVREVARIVETYAQPALVEAFLLGPEYTVTLVGHRPPRALPTLQRALEVTTGIGAHALERHPPPPGGWRHVTPGALDPALEAELVALGRRAFEALECRDYARADFRLDGGGRPHFLEINPLPTFAPDGSFGIIAEILGRDLDDLLAEILGEALARLDRAARLT